MHSAFWLTISYVPGSNKLTPVFPSHSTHLAHIGDAVVYAIPQTVSPIAFDVCLTLTSFEGQRGLLEWYCGPVRLMTVPQYLLADL